jgi:hypothetical protein
MALKSLPINKLKRLTDEILLYNEERYLLCDYAFYSDKDYRTLLNLGVEEKTSFVYGKFGNYIIEVGDKDKYDSCSVKVRVFILCNMGGDYIRIGVCEYGNIYELGMDLLIIPMLIIGCKGYEIIDLISYRVKEYIAALVEFKGRL